MAKFEIIVGSVLGATEYVADALSELIEKYQHQYTIHLTPKIEELDRSANWLICTSTHGAGDLPDNIQPFAEQLKTQSLDGLNSLIIGLGDSSYDTYCYGAEKIETLIKNAGAILQLPVLQIDVLNHPIPEEVALVWFENWLKDL